MPSCRLIFIHISYLFFFWLFVIPPPETNETTKSMNAPVHTEVNDDEFLVLTSDKKSVRLPQALLPPMLHNHGNYIISLSQLTRWLAEQAEELGKKKKKKKKKK